MKRLALFVSLLAVVALAKAEDGHQLWLRYQPVNKAQVTGPECVAAEELRTYYQGEKATLALDPKMADDAYRISGSRVCSTAPMPCCGANRATRHPSTNCAS